MTTATKTRPILSTGPEVQAILDGRKTQARRVVKPQPLCDDPNWLDYPGPVPCEAKSGDESKCDMVWGGPKNPFGQPGDRLYIKESYGVTWGDGALVDPTLVYRADNGKRFIIPELLEEWREWYFRPRKTQWNPDHWRAGRFMPRWASRITLEVTGVRVERVQEISDDDAEAEGAGFCDFCKDIGWINSGPGHECEAPGCGDAYKDSFRELWDSINAKRGYSWESNPWVWCVGFKRIEV